MLTHHSMRRFTPNMESIQLRFSQVFFSFSFYLLWFYLWTTDFLFLLFSLVSILPLFDPCIKRTWWINPSFSILTSTNMSGLLCSNFWSICIEKSLAYSEREDFISFMVVLFLFSLKNTTHNFFFLFWSLDLLHIYTY